MKTRTTWLMLLLAVVLGGLILYLEHRGGAPVGSGSDTLRVQPDRVRYLRMERDESVLELEQREGQWRITRPLDARADAGEVARLLIGLSHLPQGRLLSEADLREAGQTAADYGFRRPRARLTLGGEHNRETWLIGRSAPVGDWLYARRQDRKAIATMSSTLLELFPRDPSALRDTALFRGLTGRVERMELRRPDGFIAFATGDGGSWLLEQPVEARTQRAAVQEVLDVLFRTRAERFVADGLTDAAVYGIDENSPSASLHVRGESEPQVFRFGSLLEDEPTLQYGLIAQDNVVVAVSTSLYAVATRPVSSFRDPRLIPLHPQDIQAVRIEQADRVVTLGIDTNRVWHILEPRARLADAGMVRLLLETWTGALALEYLETTRTNVLQAVPDNALTLAFMTDSRDGTNPGLEWALHVDTDILSSTASLARVWIEPENTLALMPAALVRATPLDAEAYRDRTVLALDPAAVHKISRMERGATQTVLRVEGGLFQSPIGSAGTVQADAVKALLTLTEQLQAMKIVPERLRPAGDPLAEDRVLTLSFSLTGDVKLGKALLIGDPLPDGSGYYAGMRGHEDLFILDAGIVTILRRSLIEPVAEAPTGVNND